MARIVLLALVMISVPSVAMERSQKPQLVVAYAYHLKPPYIIDLESETGLYFDLVNYVNQRTQDFQFHLTFLPRKRLDIYLERDQLNGMVVGVNPVWFKDKKEQKYFWTSKVFDDRDEVVSSINNRFEYKGPDSLFGKSIGGVLGYYYFGINEAVDAGKLIREDANSERALLEMVQHERVFAGIVSKATFNYLVIKYGWQGRFHLSEEPHDRYTRQVMVPRQSKAIYEAVRPIVKGMLDDPAWQKILQKYRID